MVRTLGSAVSLPSLASALAAIQKLVAIGALDGALIGGVGSLGGGPGLALPELQRQTSLSVQQPTASQGGSGSGPNVNKVKGPDFPNLKDHAARHGDGLRANEDYNQAVANTKTGRPFRVYHDGEFKQADITRLGPNLFRYTATDLSGNTIFTRMM